MDDLPLVSKEAFAAEEPGLRVDLLNAQYDLRSADFAVVLLIAGDDRVGMVEVIQLLHEWLDARHLDTHIFDAPTDEELERPLFWRYWRTLPPHGKIGVYVGAWAMAAIGDHATGQIDDRGFALRLGHICRFEEALAADGTLVLKFWIHTPRDDMKERLKRARKDPRKNWQIEEIDWQLYEVFGKAAGDVERMLAETQDASAPWHVIDGRDDRTRNLLLTRALVDALRRRMVEPARALPPATAAAPAAIADALAGVDLDQHLDDDAYQRLLETNQARLAQLTRRARERGQATVLVFEGWDAAGKGGAIRRITQSMAVRDYRVVPSAAPSEEERARHYLWRFWRQLPRSGQMLIFDRSWYGRVLIERVEAIARPDEWQRAYDEIVDFEAQLQERGILVRKFWLHIDRDTQLARFQAREFTPYKKYKITDDDYRNRSRWDEYVTAVNEMVARTHVPGAPWHLIPANDKRFGRIHILETICEGLEAVLGKD